jgi:streptogramin lyase
VQRDTMRTMLVAVGVMLAGTPAMAQTPVFDVITEWRAPFPDWYLAQISAGSGDLFYVTAEVEMHLGRLDVERHRFTEWKLPFAATSPGDIRVRASDGAVFVTSGTSGEIGQFDPQTQTLRRWKIPVPDADSFEGPWSLAFDDGSGVFFTAADMDSLTTVIGRLDTATGIATTWRMPEWIGSIGAGHLTYVNGAVFFNVSGFWNVVALDLASGVFTAWPMIAQPAWDLASDSAGNVYFQEISSVSAIARLEPSSGRMTEWSFPGQFNDDIEVRNDQVLVGGSDPSGLAALDPSRAGIESVVSGTNAASVAPSSSVLVPTVTIPPRRQASARTSHRLVRGRAVGNFDLWPIDGQPRMVSAIPGAIFFTRTSDVGTSVIGRLLR